MPLSKGMVGSEEWMTVYLKCDGSADEVDFEEEGLGVEGSGHVMSAARVDLQYSHTNTIAW